jgi:hypothetical protein
MLMLLAGPRMEHEFKAFDKTKRELHTCAYCGHRTMKYCETCHSLGRGRIAVCGRKSGRDCVDRHATGAKMKHASYNIGPRVSSESQGAEDSQAPEESQETQNEVPLRRKRRRRRCADGSDDGEE